MLYNQLLASTWEEPPLMFLGIIISMNIFLRQRYLESAYRHLNLTSTQWQQVVVHASFSKEVSTR